MVIYHFSSFFGNLPWSTHSNTERRNNGKEQWERHALWEGRVSKKAQLEMGEGGSLSGRISRNSSGQTGKKWHLRSEKGPDHEKTPKFPKEFEPERDREVI